MSSLNAQMDSAIVELAKAIDHHTMRKAATLSARCLETDALNKINEAQKKVDELVSHLKKQSPRESDWNRGPGVPV